MAKKVFNNKRAANPENGQKVEKQIIKSVVWSVTLYGSETWTLRKKEAERIHAFEMEKDGENKLERQDVERACKLN